MSTLLLVLFSCITVAVCAGLFVLYLLSGRKSTVTLTKRLTFTAVLTALAVIFNVFTIQTGVKYFVISFTALPCFVAGFLLGPVEGFAVGFLGDLLGSLIHPFGAYMPLVGIASGMWGFVPGCLMRTGRNGFVYYLLKTIASYILCILMCTAFLNTYSLYLVYGSGKTYWAYLIVRFPLQTAVAVINAVLSVCLTVAVTKIRYVNNLFALN